MWKHQYMAKILFCVKFNLVCGFPGVPYLIKTMKQHGRYVHIAALFALFVFCVLFGWVCVYEWERTFCFRVFFSLGPSRRGERFVQCRRQRRQRGWLQCFLCRTAHYSESWWMLAETCVMDNVWSTSHCCKINTKGTVRLSAH